jgi:hypothetical protein
LQTARQHQPDVPTLSEAIRRLVEIGLEAGERRDKSKPKAWIMAAL